MLDLNPETVCWIIAKAHEFHVKESVVISESREGSSEDWGQQILANHSDDLTLSEIKTAIADLEPDQQASLVALMWVGRGDFDGEDWPAALEEASTRWNPRTGDYLMSTPLVADYLEEGLNQLGYSCSD